MESSQCESTMVVKMDKWKEYSKILVDVFELTDEGYKERIYNISSGSGQIAFMVRNGNRETKINFSYDVSPVTNRIFLHYTKHTTTI